MKKTRILILLTLICICFLCLCTRKLLDVPTFRSDDTVLGISVVSIDDVIKDKEFETTIQGSLFFENMPMPYDVGSGVYYIPQNMTEANWEGNITVQATDSDGDTFYLCASEDDAYWSDKHSAISENHIFEIYGISKDSFCRMKMVVTGTPIIALEIENTKTIEVTLEEDPDQYLHGAEEEYYGSFCLFDPGNTIRNYNLVESNVKFHRKGVSSKYYDKPSYSLKLRDVIGEDAKQSLLGLRESHSWKLNSLYTDENRIREKTASQIWEGLANSNTNVDADGPRMEYVEVFLDNNYIGLYCLVEAVDEEQLSLTEGEYLYKAVNWDVPSLEQVQESIADKWNVCSSMRLRYPKEIKDYKAAWEPIAKYLDVFYYSVDFDYDSALELVDMNNLADMMFFIMTIGGADNTYKNMYFSWQQNENGCYCMVQVPWDLDLTFGKLYDNEKKKPVFNPHTEWVFSETTLPRFKLSDVERMGDEVYRRWLMQREGILLTETIEELFVSNRDYLIETGAMKREAARWELPKECTEIEYLVDFQRERMEWLDTYFAVWTGQIAE